MLGAFQYVVSPFIRSVVHMIRFKEEALEKLLEERKAHFSSHTYHHLQKIIARGAKGIDPNTLSRLCGDLECLPNDIVEYL